MKFRTVLADPPWKFQRWAGDNDFDGRAADAHYTCMSLEALINLGDRVKAVTEKQAVLLMWTCWTHQEEAIRVMKAWGFQYKTGFPWIKMTQAAAPRVGLGLHLRHCSEPCLIGTRGGGTGCPEMGQQEHGIIFCPIGEHSSKPIYQYDKAEQYTGPYLELFARPWWGMLGPRDGWVHLGNEVTGNDIGDDLDCLARGVVPTGASR